MGDVCYTSVPWVILSASHCLLLKLLLVPENPLRRVLSISAVAARLRTHPARGGREGDDHPCLMAEGHGAVVLLHGAAVLRGMVELTCSLHCFLYSKNT